MVGPRGQELAGGTAHQAGTLPAVTLNAGGSLRLQLTDAHFTGVCPRLEALPWFILAALVLTVWGGVAAGWRVGAEQDQGAFRLAGTPGGGVLCPCSNPQLQGLECVQE